MIVGVVVNEASVMVAVFGNWLAATVEVPGVEALDKPIFVALA